MQTDKADQYKSNIKAGFPEAMLEPSEQTINSMTNHPKDRHVAAVAVQAKADLIVTFNLKDFPQESLAPYGIEAKHPDNFLLDLCDSCTTRAIAKVIHKQAEALKRPPTTVKDLLGRLSLQVPEFAGEILCYEYGHTVAKIADKIVKKLGTSLDNEEKIYDGNKYFIRYKSGILTITHKQKRADILKLYKGKIEGSLSLEDIEIFEKANTEINK